MARGPRGAVTVEPAALGLYIHIPFCQAICSYCNFNRGLLDEALKTRYVAALERETRETGDGRRVDTVFFGGGTPSLLEPGEVARILQAARMAYTLDADAEVTLETNPETATEARFEAFRAAGVNRISLGVQSFDAEELRRLGRIHSAERAAGAVADARLAGFVNVSLDLMLWLPGQSRASWRRTVDRAIGLEPDHLSLYLLELYPNAPLKESIARVAAGGNADERQGWAQAEDDEAAEMYLEGLAALETAGYAQYEISNVARPGRESRHNLKYWRAGDWRGLGCGAHSTMDGRRWRNVSGTADYVERIAGGTTASVEVLELGADARVEEALFTGLRLTEGIDTRNFFRRYGVDPWLRYGAHLTQYVEGGFMWTRGDRFGLTRRGMLVANEILVTFV